MSRYIDKDSAIDLSISVLCGGGNEEMAVLVEDINSAPSIEIIHCRECKHRRGKLCGRRRYTHFISLDDFCSYGSCSEKPNNSERSSE